PGITIVLAASITSAPGALMFGRTAEIFVPSIRTSASSKSPTARSRLSTQPPLMRMARPAAGAPAGAVCPAARPGEVAASIGAAAAPAAPVHRNARRDSFVPQATQPQEPSAENAEPCRYVIASSPVLAVLPDMLSLRPPAIQQDRMGYLPTGAAHPKKS